MSSNSRLTESSSDGSFDEAAPSQLEQLAAQANDAHGRVKQVARDGLLHALAAGESLLLAKRLCPMAKWLGWLCANFKASYRTAQRYMAFAAECQRLGGLDATRVSHLTPSELGRVWSMILHGSPSATSPTADDEGVEPEPVSVPATAHETQSVASEQPLPQAAVADPLPPLVELFKQLLEGFRAIAAGDDDRDGPYVAHTVSVLEPHYADLVEYLEIRKEWRGE